MIWRQTYLLSFFFLLTFMFNVNGQNNFSKGVDAYNKKDYNLAINEFEKVLSMDENNVSAWYNLGLSNIGNKSFGQAIFDFEKVLKYSPNDSESETKIEQCFAELHPELEWTPRLNSFQSSLYSLSLNVWGIICIGLSLLSAAGIVLYFQQKKSSLKSVLLFINLFLIGSFISSLVICSKIQSYSNDNSYAVVTTKSIPTFIENSPSQKTAIREGMRVEVVQRMKNDFVEVKTLNGEIHVVRAKELRFI